MPLSSAIKSRLVRCPRCRLMPPEPHNCMAYEGCKLLECQKRALARCFLVMEAGSVLLEMFGKNKLPFLFVAFLSSAFGFASTLYVSVEYRTKVQAKRQMKLAEIVFSLIQLVLTFLSCLSTVLDVKNKFNVSVYQQAFAIIAVVLGLRKVKKVTDVPLVNPQTIDSMPSTSVQIDLEPLNTLRDAGTDANHLVNDHDIPSHNIEKKNNNNNYYKDSIEAEMEPISIVIDLDKTGEQFKTQKDDKNGSGSDDGNNSGGGDDDNNGDGDGGHNGSTGGTKNEKKDSSDGNGNGNHDKGEGSGTDSGNNGNMKLKQRIRMFGFKFGYHLCSGTDSGNNENMKQKQRIRMFNFKFGYHICCK